MYTVPQRAFCRSDVCLLSVLSILDAVNVLSIRLHGVEEIKYKYRVEGVIRECIYYIHTTIVLLNDNRIMGIHK